MSDPDAVRADGYYWISDGGAAAEVAELREGAWWLVGCEESVNPRGLAVLSDRLVRPETVMPVRSPSVRRVSRRNQH